MPGVKEVMGTGDGRCDFVDFDVFAGEGYSSSVKVAASQELLNLLDAL